MKKKKKVSYLSLPRQRSSIKCWDATGSKNCNSLSIIIYHLKVQILIVFPPLDLSSRAPLLSMGGNRWAERKNWGVMERWRTDKRVKKATRMGRNTGNDTTVCGGSVRHYKKRKKKKSRTCEARILHHCYSQLVWMLQCMYSGISY